MATNTGQPVITGVSPTLVEPDISAQEQEVDGAETPIVNAFPSLVLTGGIDQPITAGVLDPVVATVQFNGNGQYGPEPPGLAGVSGGSTSSVWKTPDAMSPSQLQTLLRNVTADLGAVGSARAQEGFGNNLYVSVTVTDTVTGNTTTAGTNLSEVDPPPPPSAAQEVTQDYVNVLQRPPDAGGLSYFTGLITSGAQTPAQVTSAIVNSAEAQTAVDPMVRMYTSLGRVPDQAGLSYWVHQYEAGETPSQIGMTFLSSGEGQAIYGKTIPTAATSTAVDTTVVDDFYKEILGRAADAGGQAYWVGQIKAGLPAGAVLFDFANSAEAITRDASHVNAFLTSAAEGTEKYTGSLFAQT